MRRRDLLVGLAAALSPAAAMARATGDGALIAPSTAVALAAQAFPRGAPGIFQFQVKSTGTFERNIFLNSHEEWRSPDNLAVVIWPDAAKALAQRMGLRIEALARAFDGRTVRVAGEARRVLVARPRSKDLGPARKPYYATNIYIPEPARLGVVA